MVTTDSSLRVEYLDDRIYSVPSAHNELDWTPLGGYPYLGYLVRFGNCTIYHAGDCVPYPGLADRLRPYNITVALLPISGRKNEAPGNFEIAEAAQLAEDIGAQWLVPMHYGVFACTDGDASRFIDHLLGQRPAQRFKVFECGEKWNVPVE
jgi:L-ascorbate metabolism protein UlaG (beta-lactamase superfamily)